MPHHSRSPNRTLPQVHTAKLCSVRKANIQNAGVCNDEKAKRIYLRLPCDRQRAVPWPSRVAGQGGGRRARKSGRHRPGRPTPAATVDGLFAFKRFSPSRSQPRPTPGAAPLTLPRRPRGRCTRPNDPHGYAKPKYQKTARNLRKSRPSQNRCLNALKCSRLRFRTKFFFELGVNGTCQRFKPLLHCGVFQAP